MAEAPKIPHLVRERLRAQQAGFRSETEHPDADVLAAFTENMLARDERSRVLSHLAACEGCREAVMLSQAASDETATPLRQPTRPLLSWMSLRWASLAVVFVLTIGVVLMERSRWKSPALQTFSQSAPEPAAVRGSEEGKRVPEQGIVALPPGAKSEKQAPASENNKLAKERAESGGLRPRDHAVLYSNRIGRPADEEAMEYRTRSQDGRGALDRQRDSFWANSTPVGQSGSRAPAVQAGSGGGVVVSSVEMYSFTVTERVESHRPVATPPAAASASPGVTTAANGLSSAATQEPSKKKIGDEPASQSAETDRSLRRSGMQQNKGLAAASEVAPASDDTNFQAKDQSGGLTTENLAAAPPTPMKWRIRGGKLQYSGDEGKTWQEINLEPDVNLHSFWVQGASVWAGGTGGSLFRVTDEGRDAVRIPIKVIGGGDVSQTISTVSFSDELHGIITLENGQILRTSDGGKTWERFGR